MKKTLLCTFYCIAAFCAGLWVAQPSQSYQSLLEADKFKREAIILNDSLMKYADKVMDNNCLWDTDGGDDMASYLEFHNKIDSLYATK